MAVQINKIPFNSIPQKWAFDPEVGQFVQDLLRILRQIIERTGGDTDTIDDLEKAVTSDVGIGYAQTAALRNDISSLQMQQSISGVFAQIADLSQRINDLEKLVVSHNSYAGLIAGLNKRIDYVEMS